MADRSVIHSTFVIERHYKVAPEHVFAALSDPAKKRQWFRGDHVTTGPFEMDFQVGGWERSSFQVTEGPLKGSTVTNASNYQDIVPGRRIVFAYTMSVGSQRISASLATFELLPRANGTDLVFTEQGAFLDGADVPERRNEGWEKLLERLSKALENSTD